MDFPGLKFSVGIGSHERIVAITDSGLKIISGAVNFKIYGNDEYYLPGQVTRVVFTTSGRNYQLTWPVASPLPTEIKEIRVED